MNSYVITFRQVRVEAESADDALAQVADLLRSDDNIAHLSALPESEVAEALQFYADPESYFAIFIVPDRPSGLFADDIGCCLMDGEHDHRHGRTARRALGDEWGGTQPCDEFIAEFGPIEGEADG